MQGARITYHHYYMKCTHCQEHINQVTAPLGLSPDAVALLSRPQRIIQVSVPLRRDNGTLEFYSGYRIQYNDALGPTKGGLRYHPEVDLEEVSTLAFLMALKCSLAGLPYGGAKGGIQVNPKELSKGELERLSRAFMRELANSIGPRVDVPAPDLNTTPEIMGWMLDEYNVVTGTKSPAVITGKPLEMGGSEGRVEATALGGALVLRRYAEQFLGGKKLRIAIQGFGNVGGHLAQILSSWGHTIIAVSNSKGGVYNPDGLTIASIDALPTDYKSHITNAQLLELDCDVLVPAALGDVITKKNVKKIKASLILEMANGPVTTDADAVLAKKGVPIIPDILANAGGVIVSYFEWMQNLAGERWAKEDVFGKLESQITAAYDRLITSQQELGTDLRTAAYAVAIKRILEAERTRRNL